MNASVKHMDPEHRATHGDAVRRVRRSWRRFMAQVERQRRLEQIESRRVSFTRFARRRA